MDHGVARLTSGSMLLRADEVAYYLGISRSAAYKLISSKTLPVVRIGRSVRVPRRAVEELACATGSPSSERE